MNNNPSQNELTNSAHDLDHIVARNVGIIERIQSASHQRRTAGQVVSDAIAAFCGSTTFIWAHCLWFTFWLIWNTIPGPKAVKFDPPPFSMLTLVVSLEAIFLSTFILISQNRQQFIYDERSHLDLQINMLAEQETSHILAMLLQIQQHLGIRESLEAPDDEVDALTKSTDVERVITHIEDSELVNTPTPPNQVP